MIAARKWFLDTWGYGVKRGREDKRKPGTIAPGFEKSGNSVFL